MKNWKRTIIFWSLVILFLIVAPTVVLNARGYRFDLGRGIFVYSGTITFKSNPQNVDVSLNGKKTESKKLNRINNSYNLSGLIPKDYSIQISSPGFQTWSKKIDVHSGLSSEFWNILLVRDNYKRENLEASGVENFFISSDGEYIAYTTKEEKNLIINILNIDDKKVEEKFNLGEWEFAGKEKKENIEWSPEGDFISIPVKKGEKHDYFIINLKNSSFFQLSQKAKIAENAYNVRWDPERKGFLFFIKDADLFRLNSENLEENFKVVEDVSAFDLSGNRIYYVNDNNLVFRTSLDGKSNPVQITSNFPGEETSQIYSVIIYDETRIALISKNKDIYIYNKGEHGNYFRKLGSGIREAHFSDDGKKILYWSDFEISVYYLRDEISQPLRNENTSQEITRYSEKLSNVQWFKDYEHVIFTTGRWTKIIELDPRDHKNCMDLINTEDEGRPVVYSGRLEELFFVDSKDDSTTLYSVVFPEKTPLLGFGI